MDDSEAPQLPSQVLQADGTTEPFDPDRLHHTLFLATGHLGRPDSFLSRELTDSILHFLAERAEGGSISTADVAEVAQSVLKELGHVALGKAYRQALRQKKPARATLPPPALVTDTPIRQAMQRKQTASTLAWRLVAQTTEQYSLEEVYPLHLATVHREGLLGLGQLVAPRELAASVVRWPERDPLTFLEQQRVFLGEELVLDSPETEWVLLQKGDEERWQSLRELAVAMHWLGMQLTLHLNCREPPDWAEAADPPLFPTHLSAQAERRLVLREQFLRLWEQFPETVRLYWHVHDSGPSLATTDELLRRFHTLGIKGGELTIILDRPRQDTFLHQGMDRSASVLLHTIDLHLDVLARRQGASLSTDAFVGKALSLARLALSAAKTRREFIRRWRLPGWPAFVLDQAIVCLRLQGLAGCIAHESDAIRVDEVLHALHARLPLVLTRDGRILNLEAMAEIDHEIPWEKAASPDVRTIPLSNKLRGTLRLKGFTGTGTQLLSFLHAHPGISQVSFLPSGPDLQQS